MRIWLTIGGITLIDIGRDEEKLTLTEEEIDYLTTTPDGLSAAMDYHDLQMTQGEPMGFDCSYHQKRYDELRKVRDQIVEKWET